MTELNTNPMPVWVPDGVARYLSHTVAGRPIRDLARAAGCHASTIMRQIRRVEARRDDPLIDAALDALAHSHFSGRTHDNDDAKSDAVDGKEQTDMTANTAQVQDLPDTRQIDEDAERILRRLCETGAILAVAEGMEKAVVVRDADGGSNTRTAVVDCAVAQVMALRDWITCDAPGRISRYRITSAGRSELSRILARRENVAREDAEFGFSEAQAVFADQHRQWGEKTVDEAGENRAKRLRYNIAESPLVALARRKDRDGQPFLSEKLVHAGERLREDFELAQMGPRVAQNWDRFLTAGDRGAFSSGGGSGSEAARDRVARALADLGPGLGDVALRCCCYLEGLETAEKKMGWSARSGKIVLRIALQRLHRHYEDLAGSDQMIG